MTPANFKAIRQRAKLTQPQTAAFLRLSGKHGERHIRMIEAGDRDASGPVTYLMELLDAGIIKPVAEQ